MNHDLQIQKNAFIQHIKEMRLLDDLKQGIQITNDKSYAKD